MKVKVRKRKKSPAPIAAEQAIIQMLVSNKPNLYSVVQKAIRDAESEKETLHQNKLNENDSCGNAPSSQFLTYDIGGYGHRKVMQQAFDRVNDIKHSIKDADRIIELPENERERIFAQSIIEMMFKKIIYKNDAPISLEKRLALVESLCSFDECKNTGTVPAQCAYFDAAAHIKSLIGSIRGQL